jgi:hypothetical protein
VIQNILKVGLKGFRKGPFLWKKACNGEIMPTHQWKRKDLESKTIFLLDGTIAPRLEFHNWLFVPSYMGEIYQDGLFLKNLSIFVSKDKSIGL